jgi:hypothetical protein
VSEFTIVKSICTILLFASASTAALSQSAPNDSLTTGYVETTSFNATMFLMWTSTLPNSIAVPIAYQSWGFSGGASQNANGTWVASTSEPPPTVTTLSSTSRPPQLTL